ncbi:MAG TPA: thiol reductase thioredoxin [Thermoanaerobaculia bacterium]|nr:thiol reductase thioredoxin [Thermoanaerobaculia bacterium]
MKAYVYTDKSLERYAGRFVWLSVNTEAAETAAFLKKYPIPALPTLLVLDPKRDTVALRYVGGATVPQLRKMLDDAERSHRARMEAQTDRLLAEADQLASEGKQADAAKTYDAAIRTAPGRWTRLGRAAESLVYSLSLAGDRERCTARALELYPRLKGTMAAANVASTGLWCAIALKQDADVAKLETYTREAFDNKKIEMSNDDRSGLYMALIEARDFEGDDEGAIALRGEWVAFLEEAAAKATTPEQRTVYDSHRLSAYLDLGMPEKAVPMLEQSERDFPDDYNPPSRLAYAYKALEQYDKALAASDRALAKVYGPRKLAVLSVRADIYMAKGDAKTAKETLVQAIEYGKSLPEGQRPDKRIAAFEKRLAEMK